MYLNRDLNEELFSFVRLSHHNAVVNNYKIIIIYLYYNYYIYIIIIIFIL